MIKKLFLLIFILLITLGAAHAANETSTVLETCESEEILSETTDEVLTSTKKFSGTDFEDLRWEANNLQSGDTLELQKDVTSTIDNSLTIYTDNIIIDGRNHNIDFSNKEGPITITSDSVTLKNINFINFKNNGKPLLHCTGKKLNLTNCNFKNNKITRHFLIDLSGDEATLSNCNFENNIFEMGDGLFYFQSYNAKIINCIFKDNEEIGDSGISSSANIRFKSTTEISKCEFIKEKKHTDGNIIIEGNSVYLKDSKFESYNVNWNGAKGILSNCNFNNANTIRWTGETGQLSACNFSSQKNHQRTILWSGSKGTVTDCNFMNDTQITEEVIKFTAERCDVFNSIFPIIDKPIITSDYNDLNVKRNWFGNTIDNYKITPQVSGFNLTNWLVLDMACNNGNAVLSLDNLYDTASDTISKWSPYRLQAITFALNGENANLNVDKLTIQTGSTPFTYSINNRVTSITASYGTTNLTKFFLTEFGELEKMIRDAKGEIKLTKNYTHDNNLDGSNPIRITKPIIIDGNGFTINAIGKSQIFNIKSHNVTLKNINFINSKAQYGAIYWGEGNGSIISCNFTNNEGTIYGAGIYISSTDNIILNDCRFVNNKALAGGALYILYSTATITNCHFLNNNVMNDGSSIFIYGGGLTSISDCEFKDNRAKEGITVYCTSNSNTIFKNNTLDLNQNIAVDSGSNIFLEKNTIKEMIKINGNVLSNVRINILGNSTRSANVNSRVNLTALVYDDNNNSIFCDDLKIVLENGTRLDTLLSNGYHYAECEYGKRGDYIISAESSRLNNVTLLTGTLSVGDEFAIDMKLPVEINYKEKAILNITTSGDSDENMTVLVDGKIILNTKSNGFISIPLENLTGGNHNVTVSFNGDERYLPNSKTQFLKVNRIKTDMIVNAESEIDYGDKTQINITLPNDASGNITIKIDENTTTNPITNNQINIPLNLNGGTHKITITYNGDENYLPNTTTQSIKVNRIDPDMTVHLPSDVNYGSTASLNIIMASNATGNVTVKVNGILVENKALTQGIASIALINLTQDKSIVEISYTGDSNYLPDSTSKTINVNAYERIKIDILPPKVYGDELTITITSDDAGGNITVKVDGKSVKNLTLNGTATISISDLNASYHTVEINYTGDAKYLPNYTASNFTIKKAESQIIVASSVKMQAIEYRAGERGGRLNAILKDAKGNVLSNRNVSIKLDGKTYHVTTNSKGEFGVQVNIAKAKNYEVTFAYEGEENINGASKTTKLTITKKKTSISAKSKKFKAKVKVKKLKVKLKTVKNKYNKKTYLKAGKKLTLKVKRKIYKAKINKKGYATFKIKKLTKKGKYKATIKFKGDGIYKSSTKKIKITIR